MQLYYKSFSINNIFLKEKINLIELKGEDEIYCINLITNVTFATFVTFVRLYKQNYKKLYLLL